MSVLTIQGQIIHDTIEDVGALWGRSIAWESVDLCQEQGRGQCWEVTKSTYPAIEGKQVIRLALGMRNPTRYGRWGFLPELEV